MPLVTRTIEVDEKNVSPFMLDTELGGYHVSVVLSENRDITERPNVFCSIEKDGGVYQGGDHYHSYYLSLKGEAVVTREFSWKNKKTGEEFTATVTYTFGVDRTRLYSVKPIAFPYGEGKYGEKVVHAKVVYTYNQGKPEPKLPRFYR